MFQPIGIVFLALVAAVHSVSRPPGIFLNPPRDVYYKPGETVKIPCQAEGSPAPSYTWLRDGVKFNPSGNQKRVVQLPHSGTLVFNSPEMKDEAMYQCFAKNNFGTSVSINCNMRVARLDEFPIAEAEYHTPTLGMPYTIKCVPPSSVPDAQIIWIVDDELGGFHALNYDSRVSMDHEYRLRFTNVIREDEQNGRPYACMAMNSVMRDNVRSHAHFITVQGSDTFKEVEYMWSDPFDLSGIEGETFRMQCIFSGHPTPEIQWERLDNKTMNSRFKMQNFAQVLEIQNLQPEDAGSYMCWATNSVSNGEKVNRNFNLRVKSKPTFVLKPKDVEIGIGGNVEFTCSAKGDPEPDIKWTINGLDLNDDRVSNKKVQKPSPTKLFFANVNETDHMVIQCNASNNHGYVFEDFYLNVLSEAPEIIEPPAPRVISAEGLDVNLTCRTTGKPDPIVTWFKHDIQVSGGRFQILKDGTLTIRGVVLADASHYHCDAVNKFGKVSGDGTLIVRRKTRIEQKPGDLERNAGMDAKFTCSATTDPEEANHLRTYWLKDGDEILANDQRTKSNYQDNSLTISGTIVRDSGTYTCVATNGIDSAKAPAVLTVRDKPDPPLDVHQLDCNKNVTIEWMPGSFNNAPLLYYILQYNTSFNPDQWTFAMKVNGSWSKVSYQLSPWVDYNFRLIAHNKIGPSSPSGHTPRICTTKPDRPSYHPRNLRTLGHQRNKLYIEWTPVPQIQHNAPGFYYYLTWLRVGESRNTQLKFKTITNWTTNFYEFETGLVNARYTITIKSGNNVGEASGDPSRFDGHSYEDAPDITPTNFVVQETGDTYGVFSWEFPKSEIDKVDTKIRGQFMGFKIQFWQAGYKRSTIRDFDVGPDSAENITGNTFRSRVENLIPNTNMEASISVKNNFYIGKPSDMIRFKTEPGYPGPVDYFQVINIGDTHANLEWGSPLENRGDLEGYDISYQLVTGLELGEMQDREPQINDPYSTNGILSGLEPNRKYRIYISARTKKGRGESYFIEIVTTKQVTPEIPDFTIPSIGATYINVSWWVNAYLKSGSIIFVEYRKIDGAEWLRTSDEVVHTWQLLSNLEPGTKYEVRIKATNGYVSIPSSIEEITTRDNAAAYDLVENIGWFLGVLFSLLLLIGLIVLFILCYKRGFRFEQSAPADYTYNSSGAYSGTYDNKEHINKVPEPKGFNNDYYDDKDNYDDGGFSQPPGYSTYDGSNKWAAAPAYEDYDDGYNGAAAGQDYEDQEYPPQAGYDYDNQPNADGYYPSQDGYDYDGYNYNEPDAGDRYKDNYQGYDYDSEDTRPHSTSKDSKPASSTFV